MNPQRLEKAWADAMHIGSRNVLGCDGRLAFGRIERRRRIAKRDIGTDGGVFDSWDLRNRS